MEEPGEEAGGTEAGGEEGPGAAGEALLAVRQGPLELGGEGGERVVRSLGSEGESKRFFC